MLNHFLWKQISQMENKMNFIMYADKISSEDL